MSIVSIVSLDSVKAMLTKNTDSLAFCQPGNGFYIAIAEDVEVALLVTLISYDLLW